MPDGRTVRVEITFDVAHTERAAVGRLARQVPDLIRDLIGATDGVERSGNGISVGISDVEDDE